MSFDLVVKNYGNIMPKTYSNNVLEQARLILENILNDNNNFYKLDIHNKIQYFLIHIKFSRYKKINILEKFFSENNYSFFEEAYKINQKNTIQILSYFLNTINTEKDIKKYTDFIRNILPQYNPVPHLGLVENINVIYFADETNISKESKLNYFKTLNDIYNNKLLDNVIKKIETIT